MIPNLNSLLTFTDLRYCILLKDRHQLQGWILSQQRVCLVETRATWLGARAPHVASIKAQHPDTKSLSLHCVDVPQKNMNHEHWGGLVIPLPTGTPGDDSPSPTVLQVGRWPFTSLAGAHAQSHLGREDRCHRLLFTVQSSAPSFPQCCIFSYGERGGKSIEGRNKQLAKQRNDMSCSCFGCEQRLV